MVLGDVADRSDVEVFESRLEVEPLGGNGVPVAQQQFVQGGLLLGSEVKGRVSDWFKNALLNLTHPVDGVLFELLLGEDVVDIVAEVHPLDSLLAARGGVDAVDSQQLSELLLGEGEVELVEDALKLQASHDVLPQPIEVQEELSDPDALEGDLSLHSPQDVVDHLGPLWQPLLHVELVG